MHDRPAGPISKKNHSRPAGQPNLKKKTFTSGRPARSQKKTFTSGREVGPGGAAATVPVGWGNVYYHDPAVDFPVQILGPGPAGHRLQPARPARTASGYLKKKHARALARPGPRISKKNHSRPAGRLILKKKHSRPAGRLNLKKKHSRPAGPGRPAWPDVHAFFSQKT